MLMESETYSWLYLSKDGYRFDRLQVTCALKRKSWFILYVYGIIKIDEIGGNYPVWIYGYQPEGIKWQQNS